MVAIHATARLNSRWLSVCRGRPMGSWLFGECLPSDASKQQAGDKRRTGLLAQPPGILERRHIAYKIYRLRPKVLVLQGGPNLAGYGRLA